MIEQNSDWLAERKKGIGGSDAAAVLAEKYGCPRALFYDKTGVEPDYIDPESTQNLYARGHALEAIIAERFTSETGMKVKRMPAKVSKDRPWMRVNVDRMIFSVDETGPGYLECKTANAHVFADMRAEGMPDHYVLQVQHGLAVTGWQWAEFAILEPYTFEFMHFRVKRNEALIAVLREKEEAFWNLVQIGTVPAALADFNDTRCAKCVYRRGCRNSEALPKTPKKKRVYEPDESVELDVLVGNIKTYTLQIDDATANRDNEREKVRILLGEREAVLCPGQGKKLSYGWKSGASRWDTRALDAEQPELGAKYKRRSEPTRELRMYDVAEDAE